MKSRSAGLNALKPWRRDMGCIPQAEWRVRRVHGGCVRSLCRKPDQKRPVVCFDEKPPIAELAPTDFGQSRPARALRIAITSATAPSVCSSSSTRTGSRRKVNVVDSTRSASPPACATLATVTSQRQSASEPCWIICHPLRRRALPTADPMDTTHPVRGGAWERQRNASRARIKWMFTTENARAKAGRAYISRSSAKEA